MSDDKHLFGTVGAENLHDDIATAYDIWADDQFAPPDPLTVVEFEEWTVAPLTYTHIDWITENVADRASEEGDEFLYDALEGAGRNPDVVAAFQAAVDLMLSKTGYRMADKCIATHVITHDAEGQPMLNGERLYPEASE